MAAKGKVLVTGASGFLGSHVVKALQEAGHEVRGSVRSDLPADKRTLLQTLCPDASHALELVEADLTVADSWAPAVEGVEVVLHVACPHSSEIPEDEEREVRLPAVEGTLNVLRACAQAGTVRRVVFTSDALVAGWTPKSRDVVLTESDWSDVKLQPTAYSRCKVLAERAAWDFVRGLPENQKFELVVINPCFMLGPPLNQKQGTNVELIQKLLEKRIPACPKLNFAVVDVRDVALAHVRAVTSPEAAGERHICASGTNFWLSEMATLLKSVFGPQGYDVPTLSAPTTILRVASKMDSSLRNVMPYLGLVHKFDNSRMRQVLGVEPRNVRDSLMEMAYAMIETGLAIKTASYRGPGGPEERAAYLALKL